MSPLARMLDEQVGDVVVVAIDGEVDASNAREVGDRLRETATNRSLGLVVDLSATRYLDSAGISVLFELGRELGQRRQRLDVVVPPEAPVARMLAITGLDAEVATHATRTAALERAGADDG